MSSVRPTSGKLSAAVRRRTQITIVVGLDFGTSSTKVAYRELGSHARRIKPLFFDHKLSTYPSFCLPSVGYIGADKRLRWGSAAVRQLETEPWNSGIRRLKVLVAGQVDAAFHDARTTQAYERYLHTIDGDAELLSPSNVAAVALAQQMHLVRAMLRREYPQADLDLRFNVCIPIDQMERAGVMATYHRIHHVAERLYLEWTGDGWDEADLLETANSMFPSAAAIERSDSHLNAVPEAMAQVAAYLTSLESKQGIHAVLDIGSGTSDLSIFNLVGPSTRESRCYWYAARNEPRGAGYVEAAVADLLMKRKGKGLVTEQDVREALEGANERSQAGKVIEQELTAIWRALRKTWSSASKHHFRRQSAWSGVPYFISGGGAKLPGVMELFKKSWVPKWDDFSTRHLPVPDDFDGHRGRAPFGRLSVAYGLTYLGPELGDFRLPSDSPDHTPEIRFRQLPEPWTDGEPG